MSKTYQGNAYEDGAVRNGWLAGAFMPEGDPRHTTGPEIKWGVHQTGERRDDWVTGETRTSMALLISGAATIVFREGKAELTKPGDYVMWGPGTDHKWYIAEGGVVMTIRWPDAPSI